MKRFIPLALALLLIPAYVAIVTSLPMTMEAQCGDDRAGPGVTDKVGFCTKIGFDLQRSYYFGLLRLPVYRLGMNLDLLHRTVPAALLLLGAAGTVWLGRRTTPDDEEQDTGYSYQP